MDVNGVCFAVFDFSWVQGARDARHTVASAAAAAALFPWQSGTWRTAPMTAQAARGEWGGVPSADPHSNPNANPNPTPTPTPS